MPSEAKSEVSNFQSVEKLLSVPFCILKFSSLCGLNLSGRICQSQTQRFILIFYTSNDLQMKS
jgi:hypothetical protein